jgi:hypothetical protein
LVQCNVFRGRVQRLVAVVRWLVLAIPLIVMAAPQARAFDAAIRNYQIEVPLAGFTLSATDNCVIKAENLRVGASPAGTAGTTGTSIIDFRMSGPPGGLVSLVAATPQEMNNNTIVTSFIPSVLSVAWIEGKCGITNVTNLVQTSPNASNYAAASYHGVTWRGLQNGVRYQWEVAFTGQSNTQFINTRTAIPDEPTISSVSPNTGPTTGGTSVTINGTNLTGATQVNFGGTVIPAASFTSATATSITVLSPVRPTGVVDISVTTAGGTSPNTNDDNFTYVAATPVLGLNATVSATTQTVGRQFTFTVTPSATAAATSGTLTLTATSPDFYGFFASGTGWTCFPNPSGNATTVTCTSTTSIAAGNNGNPVTFTVTAATDSASYVQQFALSGGGATANATATAPSVTVNGLPTTQLQVASTTLTRGVPATPFIPVTATGGTAPYDWAVSPALPAGLTFTPSTGQISGTPTSVSSATNYVFTPTDARGAVPSGNVASRTFSIAVQPPVPAVASVTPNHGALGGGTSVTIAGSNFSGATEVRFGSVVRTSGFNINPAGTQITIPSPPGAALGTVQVAVVTPSGESADTPQDDFTYALPPTISTEWSAAPIPADGTTQATLSITVTNPNPTTTLTISAASTGSFPTGLNYAASSISATRTGGAVLGTSVVNIIARTYSFDIQSMPPGSTATLTLGFTSDTVGSYPFTSGTIASSAGTGAAATTSTVLTVVEAPPTISSLATRLGPLAGGTSVVINGNRFLSATGVTFDGVAAQSFIRHSQTQITAISPARATAGAVRVEVTNPAGTSPDTAADDFNYIAAPTLTAAFSSTSIQPNGTDAANLVLTITNPNAVAINGVGITAGTLPAGLTAGGAPMTTCSGGTAFLSAGAFSMGGGTVPANGSCTVTVALLSTTPGTYSYTSGNLAGPFGTAPGATTSGLTVLPLPAITSISPTLGPLAGGAGVTIIGTGFTGATEVRFGSNPPVTGLGLNVNGTGTRINVVAPQGAAAGPVRVSVVTPAGETADVPEDDFTYVAPAAQTASWVTASIPADNITPATLEIVVSNPNATAALPSVATSGSLPSGLTFVAGSDTVSQSSAFPGANVTVAPDGDYSIGISSLPAGGSLTLRLQVRSTTTGSYSFTSGPVLSSFGVGSGASTLTPLTVVQAPPTITSLSRNLSLPEGGAQITLTGERLNSVNQVTVLGVPGTATIVGQTVRVIVPSGVAGTTGRVAARNTAGTSPDTPDDDFTYLSGLTRSATFTPASIPANGTTTSTVELTIGNPNSVAITGVSIASSALVAQLSGSAPATTCGGTATLSSGSFSLSGATIPANSTCTVSFDVTSTQAGTYGFVFGNMSTDFGNMLGVATATTGSNLTVLPVPVISSISPTQGPLAGGTPVTITGSGFTGATEVRFGSNPPVTSGSFIVNGPGTQITLSSPAGSAAGPVRVSVVTAAGESADVALDEFTYVGPPTITSFTVGATVPYNTGASAPAMINVATSGAVTGTPTSYAVVSGTTAGNGTVTVNNMGIASYTPAVGFRGTDSFQVNATNLGGTSTNATVTVTVGDPAFVASVIGASARVGVPYVANVTLSGGAAPYSSFAATGLPDGLTISPAGMISGIPTRAGTFNAVVVSATDSSTPPLTANATNVVTITVAPGAQVISFTAPPTQTFSPGGTVTLSATGGPSTAPVSFASNSTSVCTTGGTNGATVTFVGAGTCSVTASQAGDANYDQATDVTTTFDIGQASQTITFTPPATQVFATGGTVPLSASATSGLGVTFASTTQAVCRIGPDGTSVVFQSAGSCGIRASQAGDTNYAPATPVDASFDIGQASQTITFTPPPAQVFMAGGTVDLSATATSGLVVSFVSNTPLVCTTGVPNGARVTFVSPGVCTVTASQAGNANFTAASSVPGTFNIGQIPQTITFPDPAQTDFVPGDTVQLTATASSGLTVEFSSLTTGACTVTTDGLVRFIKPGACTIAASQPGNATYAAAQVTKTLNIGGVDPVVEVDLIQKMQTARAQALVLNQPDLSPLLDITVEDSTALSVSSKGADIDLIRMGGPVWLRLSGSISKQAGGARDHYVQLSLGTHVSMGPQSILGIMATVDTIRLTDPTGQVEGRGWLIGPYFVTRLGTTDLIFEVRALTGRTEDRVAQIGAPVSTVEGTRSLLMAKLSGSFKMDERLTLSPSMSLAAVDQASAAYLALGGTPIPGVATSYRQAAFGLNLRHESVNTYGPLTTTGGLGWFLSDTTGSGSGQGLTYAFGIAQKIGDDSSFAFDVSGQRDFENDSSTVGLSVRFDSRF